MLSPASAATGASSIWIVTPFTPGSCSLRNIEAPLVENIEGSRQGAGGDRVGDGAGMQRGERDPRMAKAHEGARAGPRLRVDWIAVGRHDAQSRPLTHQSDIGERRNQPDRLAAEICR